MGRIVVYGYRLTYPTFSSSLHTFLSSKDFKMSYTYTFLIILYVVADTLLAYIPKEDLEFLDWIIALLVLIVVLAVGVDENVGVRDSVMIGMVFRTRIITPSINVYSVNNLCIIVV